MIKRFRSKTLKVLWEDGNTNKLPAAQLKKIRRILQMLDDAEIIPDDFKIKSAYNIHALKGTLKDYWSLTITGNYRIIFHFSEGHV
ncbi:MAG: type II toxin-antitoxin system RelE/ParE family toxin [Chitinophaga sp.]